MDERGIISNDQPMPIPDVLAVVEERLKLELSDEEAEAHFAALIEGAINALVPKLMEMAHIVAMRMKNAIHPFLLRCTPSGLLLIARWDGCSDE